ncbi:[4Fe-4S] proteins maturation [Paecilomyces lecythidis]
MAPTKMLSSTACRLARQQSSPAVLFVHHCRRASSASAATANYPTSWNSVQSPAYSIPEFLLPSRTHRTIHRLAFPTTLSLRRQRFAYSTATPSDAAKVVLNPRKDDDGNDLWMKISPRAAERLREITDPSSSSVSTTLQENPYHHLRITVTSGGCHGFQYMMSLEPASKIDKEEDTVFEADSSATPSEGQGSGGQAQVVMDTPSLELLSGSTVDYTMELIGSQFKIVDNPRATSNCGCGTSFDVQD